MNKRRSNYMYNFTVVFCYTARAISMIMGKYFKSNSLHGIVFRCCKTLLQNELAM
jgi:hypothetical protein